jgi:hypothetical protein
VGGVIQNTKAAEMADGRIEVTGVLTLKKNDAGRVAREYLLQRAAEAADNLCHLSVTQDIKAELKGIDTADPYLDVTEIVQAHSLDPVPLGNAGGAIRRAAEAANLNINSFRTKMKFTPAQLGQRGRLIQHAAEAGVESAADAAPGSALPATTLEYAKAYIAEKFPQFAAAIEKMDETEIVAAFDDCLKGGSIKPKEDEPKPDATPAAEAALQELRDRTAKIEQNAAQDRQRAAESFLSSELTTSNFPEPVKEMVRGQFAGKSFTIDEVTASIANAKTMASAFVNQHAAEGGRVSFVRGEHEEDKFKRGMIWMMFQGASPNELKAAEAELGYNPSDNKNKMFRGPRQMYLTLTGARELGHGFGQGAEGVSAAAEAAAAGILNMVAKDATYVRMIAAYRGFGDWDGFKLISKSVPVSDFRKNYFQNYGYLSSPFSTITKGEAYPTISWSGNEEVEMQVLEQGGIIDYDWVWLQRSRRLCRSSICFHSVSRRSQAQQQATLSMFSRQLMRTSQVRARTPSTVRSSSQV